MPGIDDPRIRLPIDRYQAYCAQCKQIRLLAVESTGLLVRPFCCETCYTPLAEGVKARFVSPPDPRITRPL